MNDPIQSFLQGAQLTGQADPEMLRQDWEASYINHFFLQIEEIIKRHDKAERLVISHDRFHGLQDNIPTPAIHIIMMRPREIGRDGIEEDFDFMALRESNGDVNILVSCGDGTFEPSLPIATLKTGHANIPNEKISEIYDKVGEKLKPCFHNTNIFELRRAAS